MTYQDSIVEASQRLDAESFNVDTLINNAAINPKVSSDGVLSNPNRLENFDLDSWNREINVGLTGAFLCTKVLVKRWLQTVLEILLTLLLILVLLRLPKVFTKFLSCR